MYTDKDHVEIKPSQERFKVANVVYDSYAKNVIKMTIANHGNFLEYETDVVNVELPVHFGFEDLKKGYCFASDFTKEF